MAERRTGARRTAARGVAPVTVPGPSSGSVAGVVLDLDGVLTDTAALHARAWTRLFVDVFARHGDGREVEPFGPEDYLRLVDGRPRLDGLVNVLRSRGIVLPPGRPGDPPDTETMQGVAERKDRFFVSQLRDGVPVFDASRPLLQRLVGAGVPVAVVSASRHAAEVLERTGLRQYVAVLVDGQEAQRLGLPGKPDPATFLLAARRLGVEPAQAAVVEDAVAGVQAGRRAGFRLVVGVDRHGDPTGLEEAGADLVVADLADLDAALLVAPG
ncbi:HAD family hydrolase [Aquipuribacter sp. MA13-6]|uniref:HAD family hydrolase n=1 Tax=unclassified Aquipuribacter TaxID=2635084 RepID=UPI003EEE82D2